MSRCEACKHMFHTLPSEGNDGCGCLLFNCGCRNRREACVCGEINTRHCPVHGQTGARTA